MGNTRYSGHGLKTLRAQWKDIVIRGVMKDSKKSEAEAIKIVESWDNRETNDDKYVVCDVEKRLILRDKDKPLWHPYIEKALLFDSKIDAEKCIEEMSSKNLLEKDDDGKICGLDRFRYVVGSVKAMTDKNYKYPWRRPFYAQTGIKHKIGYSN